MLSHSRTVICETALCCKACALGHDLLSLSSIFVSFLFPFSGTPFLSLLPFFSLPGISLKQSEKQPSLFGCLLPSFFLSSLQVHRFLPFLSPRLPLFVFNVLRVISACPSSSLFPHARSPSDIFLSFYSMCSLVTGCMALWERPVTWCQHTRERS